MTKQSAFNTPLFRRTAIAFGALALVLLMTLLLSPSARAFAGDLFRQFGAISISPSESGPVNEGAAPEPTIAAPPEITAEFVETASEATGLAGFDVLTPGYLPDGYALNSPWSVDNRDGSIYVVASYGNAVTNFILMNQTKFAADAHFEQEYGQNETATDVMVGQNAGLYLTGRLMAHPDLHVRTFKERPELIPTNWLIWESNGITYTLISDDLNQDQMIRMAESLSSQ